MIILGILKWIGILLLILLLLILLLLSLVLFVPIRYELFFTREGRGTASTDEREERREEVSEREAFLENAILSDTGAVPELPVQERSVQETPERRYLLTARASWLFRLLRFYFILDNDGSSYEGRLAMLRILSSEDEKGESEDMEIGNGTEDEVSQKKVQPQGEDEMPKSEGDVAKISEEPQRNDEAVQADQSSAIEKSSLHVEEQKQPSEKEAQDSEGEADG